MAFDTVETPFGEGKDLLGGSATHFAVAASFFTQVRVVAVVGEDFADEHLEPFRERGVDLEGLKRLPGKTFRWSGRYHDNLNDRDTLSTELNVFGSFEAELPPAWKATPVVFLANIDPDLQARVLDQMESPNLVAADTMNYWIGSKPAALERMLARVQVMFMNDSEIRELTGRWNIVEAARVVQDLGPEVLVVKRGEHGALVFEADDSMFAVPAYPLQHVVDPTGAGDAFAGGFLGYLASRKNLDSREYRRAAVVGSVMGSFVVESFSLERLRRLQPEEIRKRYEAFLRLTRFDELEL